MSTSLKFKEKATDLDTRSYKCLLLALVKLIHADPKLMLHVSLDTAASFSARFGTWRGLNPRNDHLSACVCVCVSVCQNPVKQAPEMQSSTAELITGLVQLVPLTNTTQLSQEAMEVRHTDRHHTNTHIHS